MFIGKAAERGDAVASLIEANAVQWTNRQVGLPNYQCVSTLEMNKKDNKMKEVFISWSGEKANVYAEFLESILNQIFGKRAETFYSGNIESGAVWLERIIEALEESKIGIIVLTEESMKKPWVNFEAGAIFKADRKNVSIIPVCVDMRILMN